MSKNNTIGVIVPEIVHYFFSSIISGIEQVADAEGYNVILCQSDESYEKEVRNTRALVATRVSGVLASLAKHTTNYDHFQDIIESDIPLVFFDRICIGINTDRVVVDDYAGAFAAVEYLIQSGCKRIAFFSSPPQLEISKNRKNGYLDALRKYGLKVDESLIRICDTREEAIIITPEILDRPDRPDGFFAINDHCAAEFFMPANWPICVCPKMCRSWVFRTENLPKPATLCSAQWSSMATKWENMQPNC
jgi:LacI family transcriptional regulator